VSDTTKYIAFDIGAESGRCVVGELRSRKLLLHEIHRFPTHTITSDGDLHWDTAAIFDEVVIGLSKASRQFGPAFGGIGVDTWGVDYVLLDSSGKLLEHPHHYRSKRTDGMMEDAWRVVPKEEIYRQTGIQFMQINTLYQLLAEKKQENFLERADCLLLMPDYFHYLISGIRKAEYTIVSTTQLSDPRTRNWSSKLISSFDLPEKIFPEVVEPGTRLGTLLPELAIKTGIGPDTAVIAGASHDTAAAVAGVPALEPNWAYLSSGTWSLLGVEINKPLINEKALAGNFTNEGGVEGTTRFLKNIAGLWIIQECRRFWAEEGKRFEYSDLSRLAKESGPASAWIDPDDPLFLYPGNMPGKVISFLRETTQRFQEDAGWVTRCVLESLAFKYRWVYRNLEEQISRRIRRLHVVGGGVQNELLNQLTSNAIGSQVVAGPVEGTICGNIGVQAIATGRLENVAAVRKVVHNSFELRTYLPQDTEYWDRHFPFFCSLLHR
jgi:rhamnulokinase